MLTIMTLAFVLRTKARFVQKAGFNWVDQAGLPLLDIEMVQQKREIRGSESYAKSTQFDKQTSPCESQTDQSSLLGFPLPKI